MLKRIGNIITTNSCDIYDSHPENIMISIITIVYDFTYIYLYTSLYLSVCELLPSIECYN